MESEDAICFTQEKCIEALKRDASMSACLTKAKKTEMVDKDMGAIFLCLGDKVVREVPGRRLRL